VNAQQCVIDWGIPLPKGIVTAQIRKPPLPAGRDRRLQTGEEENIMEVAAITGHKDLRSLQRYTHLKAEDLAEKLG